MVRRRQDAAACFDDFAVEAVKKGQLYFIVTPEEVLEGRLRIGLAEATEDMLAADGATVSVSWFHRREWSNLQRFHWSVTPFFDRAADPADLCQRYITREPLSDFLPIPVDLTPASTKQKPRILSGCVRLLTELCVHRGLVHKDEDDADDDDDTREGPSRKKLAESSDDDGRSMGSSPQKPADSSDEDDDDNDDDDGDNDDDDDDDGDGDDDDDGNNDNDDDDGEDGDDDDDGDNHDDDDDDEDSNENSVGVSVP